MKALVNSKEFCSWAILKMSKLQNYEISCLLSMIVLISYATVKTVQFFWALKWRNMFGMFRKKRETCRPLSIHRIHPRNMSRKAVIDDFDEAYYSDCGDHNKSITKFRTTRSGCVYGSYEVFTP